MFRFSGRIKGNLKSSYDFFKKNPGKYWDDYDPHYNASGYKLYAKFLYQQTEKFIKERLSK